MNPQQTKHFQLGCELWQETYGISDTRQRQAQFENTRGQFVSVVQKGPIEPEVLGSMALFYYEYCIFVAQQVGNYKEADKLIRAGHQHADEALAKDKHEFSSRLFKVFDASDKLIEKPDHTKTLFGGGGMFKKAFQTAFDQTAYTGSKNNFLECFRALKEAYAEKTAKDCLFEDYMDMTAKLMQCVDGSLNLGLNFTNVYQTILNVSLENMGYQSAEEELEKMLQEDDRRRMMLEGRVVAAQGKR
jgi:hypothetical protein